MRHAKVFILPMLCGEMTKTMCPIARSVCTKDQFHINRLYLPDEAPLYSIQAVSWQ